MVAGLTASELDELLTSQLEQYFKRPRLDVLVKQHNSKSVRLLGALQHTGLAGKGPGEYKLRGKTTVLEMITVAGRAHRRCGSQVGADAAPKRRDRLAQPV